MKYTRNLANVAREFDRSALATVCAMPEAEFGPTYGMERFEFEEVNTDEDYYFFKDNGSNVLAVAHLDTVMAADRREAHFIQTEAGEVVYSGALDDRLGAYIILHLLPALGIQYDILLTVGEESGQSTAEYFDAPEGREYDWMIEFDRGGTDVVMYQYDDDDTRAAVRACGARPADGIFSDISYLEHLGIKGFNWGVGYRDYHGPRSHAYLDDTFEMVARYLKFHQQNEGRAMPHEEVRDLWRTGRAGSASKWDYWSTGDDQFDDDGQYINYPPREIEYFDREYIEDPTIEEMQAHMEAMDDELHAALMRDNEGEPYVSP